MERAFEGIWIPKEIWLNEDLNWIEKNLFVEIKSLANNGECFASNEYFAKFFGLSKDRISKLITGLSRKSLVKVTLIYKEGTKQIIKRIITPIEGIGKNTETSRQTYREGLGENTDTPIVENTDTPIGKNAYDNNIISFNNTSFNNTVNNTTNKRLNTSKQIESEFAYLWSIYPNKKSKMNALKAYEKARKLSGVTFEDVKKGIQMYIDYIKFHELDITKIKHGSTWFNQHCWEDQYETNSFKKKYKYDQFTELILNEMDSSDYIFNNAGVEQYDKRRDPTIIFND